MKKKKLWIWILCPILFIGTVCVLLLLLNSIYNNKKYVSRNFPLREKWSLDLENEIVALSTNKDRILFARTENEIYAINGQSGDLLWRHDLAWQGIPRPPIAANGLVYLADGKAVWAFDQDNGNVKWTHNPHLYAPGVAFVSRELVVVVEMNSSLHVFNAVDGAELWSIGSCRGGIQPYIYGSFLYSPCYDGMTVAKASTGKIEWEGNIPYEMAAIAYQDYIMYYSPDRNSIAALDLRTRRLLWASDFHDESLLRFFVFGNYLLVTGSDRFCAFYKETGNLIRCTDFAYPENPVLLDNRLFVFNGYQNKITVFDFESGKKIGELSIKDFKIFMDVKKMMTTIDDTLIFGNGSRLYAFGE